MTRLRRGNVRPGVRFTATVRQDRRPGFTLVELLVCMALIMFMMAILSQAFVAATGVFRNLKAAGDMAEKLRATTTLLQRDLSADHFEGKKRLSDPYFWLNGPPQQGFFRIWQGSAGTLEGTDPAPESFGSYRSTDHMLAFTVKLRGNQMSDFLSASPPAAMVAASNSFGPPEARYQTGSTYNWQWAEVTWFLQAQFDANGNQDTTDGTIPLFTLYRNQRLAVPDSSWVYSNLPTASAGAFNYSNISTYLQNLQGSLAEVSSWPNTFPPPLPQTLATPNSLYFNDPIDLTVPSRRFGVTPTNLNIQGVNVSNPAGMLLYTAYPPTLWPVNQDGTQGNWSLTSPGNGARTYPTLAQLGATGSMASADIQLTNVVSFDVRLLVQGVSNGTDPFVTLWQAPFTTPVTQSGMNNYNPAFYDPVNNPFAPMVFDTWTSVIDGLSQGVNNGVTQGYYSTWNLPGPNVPPTKPGTPAPPTNTNPASAPGMSSIPLWNGTSGPIIQALQITIRIWDQKTNQTRQVTIIQAM